MNPQESELGFFIDTPRAFFFFGKKNSSFENLRQAFPNLSWARIRQTHSDLIVTNNQPTVDPLCEADAQDSEAKNLALVISTADCVPILLFHPQGYVAAVHAGWRGVENRILPKTLSKWKNMGIKTEDAIAVIGPHIQMKSFEVDLDVAKRFPLEFQKQLPNGKITVDLNSIVKNQLLDFNLPADHVFDLHIDTKTDERFHSHRRDRERAGRNLSFIYQY